MRSWTLTVKTDMTASGTLSHEGTRRFTGSKSVAVCLGWPRDGRHFGFRQSGQPPRLGSPLRDPRPSGYPGSRWCGQTYLTTWCMSWMTITTPEASKKSITITRILRAARQNATHAMASAMMKGSIYRFLTGSAVASPSPPTPGIASPHWACMVSGTTGPFYSIRSRCWSTADGANIGRAFELSVRTRIPDSQYQKAVSDRDFLSLNSAIPYKALRDRSFVA